MKTIRVEHGYQKTPWVCEYIVNNNDPESQWIDATLFYETDILVPALTRRKFVQAGGIWKTDELTIHKKDGKILHKDLGRHTVIFNGPDSMTVIGVMSRTDEGGYGYLPQREARTLIEAVPPAKNNILVQLFDTDTPYWRFKGTYPYLKADQLLVLQYMMKRQHYDFPDRIDRAVDWYDLCSNTNTNGPEHPESSHAGYPINAKLPSDERGNRVDMSYWTLERNNTQFPGGTGIWTDGNSPSATLLPVYDFERNDNYFSMKEALTVVNADFNSRVDKRIGEITKALVDCDDPLYFKHHKHHHDEIGDIRWEASW